MSYKNYLVRKRCKIDAICGPVNLRYGTLVVCHDDFLFTKDGKKLCHVNSQNAFEYFSHNDDGMGAVRGHLVQSIIDALSFTVNNEEDLKRRNDIWAKVWSDPLCSKFKRRDHENFWLWDVSFYNAEVEELREINKLVGGKSNV